MIKNTKTTTTSTATNKNTTLMSKINKKIYVMEKELETNPNQTFFFKVDKKIKAYSTKK